MSFKELDEIKDGYDSGFDDILNEFYTPVLRKTLHYKRIVGFFSSSSLSVAARGIEGLVHNGGDMQMLVSPRLSKEDVRMIELAEKDPERIISDRLCEELDNLETLLQKKRVEALGWLVANGYLKIKIAVVYDANGKPMSMEQIEETGLFHIKVGVLEDECGNIITFSGSVNETASAWVKNVEEFKVFREWVPGQKNSAHIDIDKFDKYWKGESPKVKNYDVSDALREKLIRYVPKNFDEIEKEIVKAEIEIEKERNIKNKELNFNPFSYQLEALSVWQKKHRAIFEMATGTGKTKTAEVCIADYYKNNMDSVVFIICPQDALVKQWIRDIENSGIEADNYVLADSTNYKWRDQLELKLLDLSVEHAGKKHKLFVYSTFDTFCSKTFIEIVSKNKNKLKYFIIGDEVHGLGSWTRAKGLLDIYDYRLGLSATPDRWYDDYGTSIINNFFGNDRFVFSLHQALTTINPLTGKTYLTPYEYIPKFVTLTPNELYKYSQLTKEIIKNVSRSKKDSKVAEKLERLLFIRADIHKSAENKFVEFERILDEIGDAICDTIIFVSPGQIDNVLNILRTRKISAHELTNRQGNVSKDEFGGMSERESIIQAFKDGNYQALVAMKCLDEGVDIPSAKCAIILASSTNPREYVQRIGRVIRRNDDKKKATIFDIVIEPSYDILPEELAKQEKNIFRKEMNRIKDISENAMNRVDIIEEVYKHWE